MKKSLLFLAGFVLIASSASAIIDPQNDSMSFYFDTTADMWCLNAVPLTVIPAHLILVNSTMPALYGYEFGYTLEGNFLLSGTTLWGTGAIDVGGYPGNHIVGLGAPLMTAPATILCTLEVLVLDYRAVNFFLGGANPPSIPDRPEYPVLLLADSQLLSANMAVPPGTYPCARINDCGLAAEETTWDRLKSLYR